MNSCILMVEIIKEPELRYTPDGLELTEMLVQFSATREGESPATLRVVGWGNLAKEVQQSYHVGDRVLVEGRLGMHTIDRPEGFKEKRAELTLQKIYPLVVSGNVSASPAIPVASAAQKTVSNYESPPLSKTAPAPNKVGVTSQKEFSEPVAPSSNYEHSSYSTPVPNEEPDIDDIPF
ncbi:single-stranded DNA-binding protein [Chlorogloeopsis sp. ULAP01]|uniref:single-stranded DNA-binding protein n=1 Tax=Chlorogloeopsis sp. ULAP01 TaxID=3056483 RepID=UPI0025AB07DF|nr:single-stranded DNA-binding protein [Chlorogloeopsis sp. ULAP01]MDM9380994.1 single-stranded DNA-binding protein [Chlorogloeopsis sp. ULAP01]